MHVLACRFRPGFAHILDGRDGAGRRAAAAAPTDPPLPARLHAARWRPRQQPPRRMGRRRPTPDGPGAGGLGGGGSLGRQGRDPLGLHAAGAAAAARRRPSGLAGRGPMRLTSGATRVGRGRGRPCNKAAGSSTRRSLNPGASRWTAAFRWGAGGLGSRAIPPRGPGPRSNGPVTPYRPRPPTPARSGPGATPARVCAFLPARTCGLAAANGPDTPGPSLKLGPGHLGRKCLPAGFFFLVCF